MDHNAFCLDTFATGHTALLLDALRYRAHDPTDTEHTSQLIQSTDPTDTEHTIQLIKPCPCVHTTQACAASVGTCLMCMGQHSQALNMQRGVLEACEKTQVSNRETRKYVLLWYTQHNTISVC